ncbi:MAG: hypothetical protein K0Q53_81 [Massilibacillus sp.]|jgi:hypothetical protein|nr:hypothetical protein [Massilibacillus sp.]
MPEELRYDEKDYNAIISTGRFDANESIFFARELEKIKAKSYDVLYPEFTAIQIIPVSTDAGAGAETITYYQYDVVGFADIISNYATDLPRVDLVGKPFSSKVKSIGTSYGYSIQDIRAAQMAGKPLEQRKANAARRANDQKVNNIAYSGDAANGLNGLFTHPNITSYTLPTDGTLNGVTAGTAAAAKFINKTPDQVLRDLTGMVNTVITITKKVERPDTLVLPHNVHGDISSRARTTGTDTTILEFFLKTNPYIKNVEVVPEAQGAGTGGVDLCLVYKKDPDKLTLEIPQPFEQFPPQPEGLEFVTACHSRCGGVIIYYPLSICKSEGC